MGDLVAEEHVPFRTPLDDEELVYLQRLLGGSFTARRDDFVISGVVGHVVMPSRRVLRIRSRKAPAASVIAWSAYVDPLLRDLRVLGEAAPAGAESDVAALVAWLFLAELNRALRAHGLARTYLKQRTVSSTVRGRIDFSSLVRQAGDLSRVPCEVWERQPRSPAMCMLAAAVDAVSTDPLMRVVDPAALRHASNAFVETPRALDPHLLAGRRQLNRSELGFQAALGLARIVLKHRGMVEGAEHSGLAYLVRLDVLFERAVVLALREGGIAVEAKHPLPHERVGLDGASHRGDAAMEVDAYCPSLAPGGVAIDAKYKSEVSSGNLQQILAYCLLTGARRAALAVPSGLLRDVRAYRFAAPSGDVVVQVLQLDLGGRDLPSWRAAGADFARRARLALDGAD